MKNVVCNKGSKFNKKRSEFKIKDFLGTSMVYPLNGGNNFASNKEIQLKDIEKYLSFKTL